MAFAALLLVTAVWFAFRARRPPVDEQDDSAGGHAHTQDEGGDVRTGRVVAAGAGIGALPGILGVGGGFVIVPPLTATPGSAMAGRGLLGAVRSGGLDGDRRPP